SELQVSASGGTEDVANLLENQFSAGDASLEEKERVLYADAVPPEKTLLLHFPDGSEADSPEKNSPGASPMAAGPGADPEASLSSASALESALPGDDAGPGEEEEGPLGASALPPEGKEGPLEEKQPELSPGEGPGEEEAGNGLPMERAVSGEAEGQVGSGEVPEEAEAALEDDLGQKAAAGTVEPEASGVFHSGEVEEVHSSEKGGKGSSEPDQEPEVLGEEPEVLGGVPEVESVEEQSKADADPEARAGPEDQEEPEDQGKPSPSQEAGAESGRAQGSEAGQTKEDCPPVGPPQEVLVQGPDEASSEEEGDHSDDGDEDGIPSKEESEENSGSGASSEEAGSAGLEEAGESQEAAESSSHGEEGAQPSTEELSTRPKGMKAQNAEAEDPEEGQQGRGPPHLILKGRSSLEAALAVFQEVSWAEGQPGTEWVFR
ncbi:uncharacterized protein LOC111752700, partial [Loxodonta africana]|uniref:uncharacterized protein LOC111752700 n=1 Tax=Loxodonta africana TaxID=9785 RepID=UPI0030D0FFC2